MSVNFSQKSPLPRIKHLQLGDTVGQGSFAFVKRACLETDPNTVVAVKFVHLPTCAKHGLSEEDVTQEVILQSKCSGHPNVLKVIDCNLSRDFLWIIMEMASGGDLFDKIEPDVGVDAEVARFYYKQLINALDYLHRDCGIAHRDVKPENILLDRNGNLKLADFGLASKFRRKDGTKRVCTDTRGSLPYMAPEIVYSRGYYADLTDVWSCGILLFVLLTGETPWDIPSEEDDHFREFWVNRGKLTSGPWAKLDFTELNLLRKILQPEPTERYSLDQLKSHSWYTNPTAFANEAGICANPRMLSEKLMSRLHISLNDDAIPQNNLKIFNGEAPQHTSTQPAGSHGAHLQRDFSCMEKFAASQLGVSYQASHESAGSDVLYWSQHIQQDMATQQFCEFTERNASFLNPAKLTKFYSTQDVGTILNTLELALLTLKIPVSTGLIRSFSKLTQTCGHEDVFPLTIQVKTKDRKGWDLSGNITLFYLERYVVLLYFNRRKGDPLEWRRLFRSISVLCRDLIFIP
ncbi:LAME_0H04170g1_1 [Lachancea meyersii CBS 8951]|uniref:non-specific serine/threonine protein kinase n=1 Tax=Lachancea meyersii CBS 8951 TaxID=1266667 RepID=A0A1G4KDU2_9SACH|nr:LAME_0H04170g1_1 [Lachancea meyersii CBS 8951]